MVSRVKKEVLKNLLWEHLLVRDPGSIRVSIAPSVKLVKSLV